MLSPKEICARYVRAVGNCRKCLHNDDCDKRTLPAPTLSRYMIWLQYKVFPDFERSLEEFTENEIKLKVRTPYTNEVEESVYVVINIYEIFKYNRERLVGKLRLYNPAYNLKGLFARLLYQYERKKTK